MGNEACAALERDFRHIIWFERPYVSGNQNPAGEVHTRDSNLGYLLYVKISTQAYHVQLYFFPGRHRTYPEIIIITRICNFWVFFLNTAMMCILLCFSFCKKTASVDNSTQQIFYVCSILLSTYHNHSEWNYENRIISPKSSLPCRIQTSFSFSTDAWNSITYFSVVLFIRKVSTQHHFITTAACIHDYSSLLSQRNSSK